MVTFWWGDTKGHGAIDLTFAPFPPGVVNSSSLVFATATETKQGTPFFGPAVLTVHNVIPQQDSVVVVLQVGLPTSSIK
jgi:hypothetical protein